MLQKQVASMKHLVWKPSSNHEWHSMSCRWHSRWHSRWLQTMTATNINPWVGVHDQGNWFIKNRSDVIIVSAYGFKPISKGNCNSLLLASPAVQPASFLSMKSCVTSPDTSQVETVFVLGSCNMIGPATAGESDSVHPCLQLRSTQTRPAAIPHQTSLRICVFLNVN